MKTALVVNCSAPHYNLGAAKLADWLATQGYAVTPWAGDPGAFSFGYDLVCLSVIFSWHAPIARDIALRVESEVWCGGPGMTALVHWWKTETGRDCTPGIDARFDHQRGDYPFTFASRGCPVGCWFCVVPKLEGLAFTLDWDFRPASVLCDNNLSALPDAFQDHILARYAASGVKLLDCNSGFEPRTFTADTYQRWRGKFKGAWRFAYDEQRERPEVEAMMRLLAAESARKKQVYVLVGNESIDACHERAQQVIAWGGEPHCQFVLPLNWLGDPDAIRPRHDWTYQLGRDFCRYYNTRGWRSYPISEYKPRVNEPEPFKRLAA
jgi:hypothetical protein